MEKYEPKKDFFPPIQLPRYNINSSPKKNYVFEQYKINDFYQVGYQGFSNKKNNINENLSTSIGITFNELESLTKDNLIQLIQFINYSCNLHLKDIKFSNCCCGIFGIKENLNRNGYSIVISKNEINELHSKYRNKKEDINGNNINLEDHEKLFNKINNETEYNFFLLNEYNEVKHNYCLPISCPSHSNVKFNSLSSYLIHCKEDHKIFTCKDCGIIFDDFNNFKLHIYKILNIEDENIIINIKDNDAPPLLKDSGESTNLETNIKCTKCELIFDSVEKMSIHFYEAHEKKIIEESKKNEEFLQSKSQSIDGNVNENSVVSLEPNENEEKIDSINQGEEENVQSEEEVKKKSTFKGEEEMQFIEDISKENSTKKESKYLQRKRNYDEEENKDEIIIEKEELKKQDDLKEQEDQKRQKELKKQEELKNQDELEIQDEPKNQKDLKEEEINNDGFYFRCVFCHGKKKFPTQLLYIEHFKKEHSAFCFICGKKKKFYKNKLSSHYNSKKSHNNIRCKLCSKTFSTVISFIWHCKDKNH